MLIIGLSAFVSLLYNLVSRNALPIFRSYNPGEITPDSTFLVRDEPFISEIDTDMLISLMESKQVILLDARDEKAFSEGHIPTAINLPLSGFEKSYGQLAENLQKSQFIVTYSGTSSGDDSYKLAIRLHNHGLLDVFVYPGGFEAWRDHGKEIIGPDYK